MIPRISKVSLQLYPSFMISIVLKFDTLGFFILDPSENDSISLLLMNNDDIFFFQKLLGRKMLGSKFSIAEPAIRIFTLSRTNDELTR